MRSDTIQPVISGGIGNHYGLLAVQDDRFNIFLLDQVRGSGGGVYGCIEVQDINFSCSMSFMRLNGKFNPI